MSGKMRCKQLIIGNRVKMNDFHLGFADKCAERTKYN